MDVSAATPDGARGKDSPPQHQTRLVTVVFTDLVDSVVLRRQLGDQAATTLLRTHRQIVRELLQGAVEAEEIETAGDSFLLLFARPSDAVKFALVLEQQTGTLAKEHKVALAVRIGIHVGEVVIEEHVQGPKPKDLYGSQIDLCARVMGLAQGRQILLTRAVFDSARQALKGGELQGLNELQWLNHGPYVLKGIEEPVDICEVGEVGIGLLKAPAESDKAQRRVRAGEEPVLGWRPAADQVVPNTRWRLEKKLGEGGFGEVWLGRHQTMKERRVFKFCFRAERVRFLKREMTLFRLIKERIGDHPNIVALREVYFDAPPFYVEMDYVEGKDLRSWSEEQGGVSGVPLETRLEIVAQIADGLQAAHDAGVIHRDIKPTNILVGKGVSHPTSGNPLPSEARGVGGERAVHAKLTDFGIGQVVSEEYLAGVTRAGFTETIMSDSHTGTQMYMAPELLAGKSASIRSDIYSLGVVLYQLFIADLTRPLATDWVEGIADPLLQDDLRHCFAGNPYDRFAGAGQLAKHLRALPERRAALERQRAEQAAAEKAAYRRGIVRAAAAAGVILAVVAGLAMVALKQSARAKAAAARALVAEKKASEELVDASRNLYAADMLVAQNALAGNDLGGALKLLNRHRPKSSEPDLRGWEWRYLWKLCRSDERFTLCTLSNGVLGVLWYPDGQHLLTLENSGALTLWDTLARKQTAFNPDGANILALSPDGQTIANSTEAGIRLLRASTLREVAPPLIVSNGVQALTFDRDGRRIVVIGNESLMEWDLDTRGLVAKQSLPAGYSAWTPQGMQTVFSPDRRTAVLFKDGAVLVWDRVGAHSIANFQGPSGSSLRAFAPDGDHLAIPFDLHPSGLPAEIEKASVPYDTNPGDLRVWEVSTLREVQRLTNHIAWTYTLAYSPNGQLLATGGIDQKLRLWDTSTWREVARLRGHLDEIWNIAFSPDGKSIATGSKDRTVRIWDATPRHEDQTRLQLPEPLDSFCFSPQGDLFFTLSAGRAEIRESRSLRLLQSHSFGLSLHEMHTRSSGLWERPASTAVSPHGSVFAFATEAGPIELWDGQAWKKITDLPSQGKKPPDWMAFSAKGDLLLTREEDSSVISVWRLTNLTKPELTITNRPCINALCKPVLSPEGNSIASMGKDWHTAEIWDLRGKTQAVLAWHLDNVYRVAFSMDSGFLATSSADGTAAVWDLKHPQQPIARLRGQLMNVTAFAFSPDGYRLAAGNGEGTIKLYDFTREQELSSLHTDRFGECLALFFIDDDTLVARVENNIIVWHAASAAEIVEELRRGEHR